MNTFQRLGRVFVGFCIVLILLGTGITAQGQAPTPPIPPVLIPENNPLDLNAAQIAPLQPVPTLAASGGSPDSPLSLDAVNLAGDDRYNTDITAWSIWARQSATDVTNTINAGYRLIDIKVDQVSPSYLFTGTYVADSGTYDKTWWWYYGVDGTTLGGLLGSNNARLISLKAYDIGAGQIRFTAVMVSNTGADASGWWWYYGQTVAQVTALLQANQARLTQVNAYVTGGQTRYAVVMVDNTGVNSQSWWWYVNATVGDLSAHVNANSARLIDLDRDPSTGNYNAVMTGCSGGCPMWWWWVGVPENQLINRALQDGARIIDANSYVGCGGTCYDVVYINNSNPITSRVGEMLRSRTDGTVGLFLKRVNGSVLANLMDATAFEPASTIKAGVNLYTMQRLKAGPDTLSTLITRYAPPVSGSCPGNTSNGTETINFADQEMMWHSDNTRTRELVDYNGVANINAMFTSLGMANTSINHIIGCGGPTPNQTTLDDLATLYEKVANGTVLDPTYHALFFNHMAGKAQFAAEGYDWTGLWTTDIPNLIAQEAPAGMTAAAKEYYRGQIELSYKAGNYKICPNGNCNTYVDHISIFGYAQLPFCDGGGARQFVFGTYIYNATSDTNSNNAFIATKAELLREQIHAGLASCKYVAFLPNIIR